MEVEYTVLYTSEQVLNMDSDALYQGLTKAMAHDEVAYQEKRMIKIKSAIRAEYISHALYLCPECQTIDSFEAKGNDFRCTQCNYTIHINDYGFFELKGQGKLHFRNIRDWYNWGEKTLIEFIRNNYQKQSQELLFLDKAMQISKNDASGKLVNIGLADVSLYCDKMRIDFHNKEVLDFNFNDLQTINPQTRERLEIYYKDEAYRVEGTRPGVSALKWEVAVNTIWKEMGLTAKMVPYVRF